MKNFIIAGCAFVLIAAITAGAYNSGKGQAKQIDGITELPMPKQDSLVEKGKELVARSSYNDAELEAISAYLHSK